MLYGKNKDIVINDSSKYIRIANSSLASRLLQNFGDFIPKLSIDEQYAKEILENIRVSLKRVESFRTSLKCDANDVLPFSHVFPNMRELNIQLYSNVNLSMIDCASPALQALTILIWGDNWNEMDSIDGLIQKNSQIKSINLHGVPDHYIKFINSALPILENITFFWIQHRNETIELKSVKHAVFESKYEQKKIRFEHKIYVKKFVYFKYRIQ